jgi:hypothetical protein
VEPLAVLIDRVADRLPPGRLVTPEGAETPRLWVSEGPAAPGDWQRWHAAHAETGLWPLLLRELSSHASESGRPWLTGELMATEPAEPDLTAEEVLSGFWDDAMPIDDLDEDDEPPARRADGLVGRLTSALGLTRDEPDPFEDLAPYGRHFPGLAPSGVDPGGARRAPDQVADEVAAASLRGGGPVRRGVVRLGLVAAARSADTIETTGWFGPVNSLDPVADLAVVLRSWEDRFGVRVVELGFDTLTLSVAAPPTSLAVALPIAAERFAVCPDQIWQGVESMRALAEETVNADSWWFWWD